MTKVEIKILSPGDLECLRCVGPDVFDDPIDVQATETFLSDPRHHLCVAVVDDRIVGFASAVHYVHPDKPRPEMWINEVGVASTHQGQGLGKRIIDCVLERARSLGCTEAWLTTDRSNTAAVRLYESCGGAESPHGQVMFEFQLDQEP